MLVSRMIHWSGNTFKTPGGMPSEPAALLGLSFLVHLKTSETSMGSSSTGMYRWWRGVYSRGSVASVGFRMASK